MRKKNERDESEKKSISVKGKYDKITICNLFYMITTTHKMIFSICQAWAPVESDKIATNNVYFYSMACSRICLHTCDTHLCIGLLSVYLIWCRERAHMIASLTRRREIEAFAINEHTLTRLS